MKPVDEEQELTRLLAQEPSPLTSSLAALRDHGPDATELASLASRLALQGLDVSVSQPPSTRANPWKKWGWGGLGGVSAVVIGLALRGSPSSPEATRAVTPAARVPIASAAVTTMQRGAVSQSAGGAEARMALGDSPSRGSADQVATAGATVSGAASIALVEEAKGATSSAKPSNNVHGLANNPSNPSVAPAHTGAAARAAGSSAPLFTGTVAPPSEMELLRDARLVLRQSPARALELSDEHGRLYPQGKMTQERELIAVSALVALGRRTAALSRAASFERQFPMSPYRRQMGELLR